MPMNLLGNWLMSWGNVELFHGTRRIFTLQSSHRILFLCITVGEELLVGVVMGAVGVRIRVRVRMIDSQPMPLPPQ